MLALLLRELVAEAVVEAHDLAQEDHFDLTLVARLLRHGEDVEVLGLSVGERLLVLELCEGAQVGLQAEEAHELLFVEAALREEASLDDWEYFHL